jgi:uncharacterized protein YceK
MGDNMKKKLGVIVAIVLLTGCPKVIPSQPEKMTNAQLCRAHGNAQAQSYSKGKLPALKAEIKNRGLVPDDEWSVIEKREVMLGMSLCGLRASWGSAKENVTSTRYGESIQHVYRLSWCHRCNVQYVYTENGVVTAIQD